jgi:membrane protease YdiL (CAAX protease family)
MVAFALFAWLGLHFALSAAAGALTQTAEPAPQAAPVLPAPGTSAWHLLQLADALANVLSIPIFAFVLRAARRPKRVPGGRGVLLAVGGVLLVVPPVTVQWRAGVVLWDWLYPHVAAPLHPVLLGVGKSAWGAGGIVQLVVAAVVVAPLTEELLFRGIVLEAFCRYTRLAWVSILGAAVVFGLLHGQPQDILPLVTLGVFLGYIRLRGGALWPCVLLHALFNARTMLFVLLAPEAPRV